MSILTYPLVEPVSERSISGVANEIERLNQEVVRASSDPFLHRYNKQERNPNVQYVHLNVGGHQSFDDYLEDLVHAELPVEPFSMLAGTLLDDTRVFIVAGKDNQNIVVCDAQPINENPIETLLLRLPESLQGYYIPGVLNEMKFRVMISLPIIADSLY